MPMPLDGVRILIVEDHVDSSEALELWLTHLGAEVGSATSAVDALELLRSVRPDVIVCDIHMPRMDGYGFLNALRSEEHLNRIPVIAVTGDVMEKERLSGAGFDGYLLKPAKGPAIADEIAAVLRR